MHRRMLLGLCKPKFLRDMISYFPFNSDMDDKINPVVSAVSGTLTLSAGKLGNAVFSDNLTANALRSTGISTKFQMHDNTDDIPFSISLWLYATSRGATYGHILGYNNLAGSGNNHEYALFLMTSNKLRFTKYSEGASANTIYIETSNVIPFNEWLHVVYTDNKGSDMKLYINGALASTTIATTGTGFVKMQTQTTAARLGLFSTPGLVASSRGFGGGIDDLGFMKSSVMTLAEVQNIYNSGSGKTLK